MRRASAIASVKSSRQRDVWSSRHPVWRSTDVARPRLPRPTDRPQTALWSDRFSPPSLVTFVGGAVRAAEQLQDLVNAFEDHGTMRNVLIYGPPGSGKSALARIYLRDLMEAAQIDPSAEGSRIRRLRIEVSAKNLTTHTLLKHVDKLLGYASARETFPYRILVVDDVDRLSPSLQQVLRKAMEENADTIRVVLLCRNHSKLINQIKMQSIILRTMNLTQEDALRVVMEYFRRNRIGSDRGGLRVLFQAFGKLVEGETLVDLKQVVDTAQHAFADHHMVTEANVRKYVTLPDEDPRPTVPYYAPLLPLDPCPQCTLLPPCQHTSAVELCRLAEERRRELPRYRGGMPCVQYVETGGCPFFNEHKHCSLDHPPDFHQYTTPPIRCRTCTLPWPCGYCEYTVRRESLLRLLAGMRKALELLAEAREREQKQAARRHRGGGGGGRHGMNALSGSERKFSVGAPSPPPPPSLQGAQAQAQMQPSENDAGGAEEKKAGEGDGSGSESGSSSGSGSDSESGSDSGSGSDGESEESSIVEDSLDDLGVVREDDLWMYLRSMLHTFDVTDAEEKLSGSEHWVASAYSVEGKEYTSREKFLRSRFPELVRVIRIHDKITAVQRKRGRVGLR